MNPTARRLSRAHDRRPTSTRSQADNPRGLRYVDGAADEEVSIRNARNAYRDSTFHPRILQDISNVDTSAGHVIGSGTERVIEAKRVIEANGATSAHASRISRQIDGEVHAAGQSRLHPGQNRVVER